MHRLKPIKGEWNYWVLGVQYSGARYLYKSLVLGTVLFPCSMHYNIPLFKFKVPLEVSPPYGKTVWKGMEPDAIKQCHRHGLLGPTDFGIFVFLNSLSAICHLP